MKFNVIRPEFKNVDYNILDFGAKSSYDFNNRIAIQKTIDECEKNGGGRVIIPNGFFKTGPITLKSNVNLYLESGAYLSFLKSEEEYPLIFTEYEGIKKIRCISPINAKDKENIAITGSGVIDGNGHLWRGIKKFKVTDKMWERLLKESTYVYETKESKIWCPTKTYYDGLYKGEPDYSLPNALEIAQENWDMYRPVMVSLINCDKILIEGVTLMNSPAWNIHPLYCTNFTLKDAKVKNTAYAQNGDGLDLESSKNCEIVNTEFSVGDDGICIKSGKNRVARQKKIPTENVWIHGCKVLDAHGGFVVGSEMSRGVKNILIEDCIFAGTDLGIRFKSAMGRGGVVEDITIKNIQMSRIIGEAMIFTMGYKLISIEDTNEGKVTVNADDVPEFKNIYIENIHCDSSKVVLKIEGLPEKKIHDIYIKDSFFEGEKEFSLSLCENIKLINTTINNKYYKEETLNN